MIKKPRAHKQKLKVFRTPIGFHDAYVGGLCLLWVESGHLTEVRAVTLRSTLRRIFRPIAAKPKSIITQVAGSGTGAGKVWITENVDAAKLL